MGFSTEGKIWNVWESKLFRINRIFHPLKLLIFNHIRKHKSESGAETSLEDRLDLCTFFIHCTWKHKGEDKVKLSKNLQDTDPVQWQYLPRYAVYIHSLWVKTGDGTMEHCFYPGNKVWDGGESPKGEWIIPKYVHRFLNKSHPFILLSKMAFSCASLEIIF